MAIDIRKLRQQTVFNSPSSEDDYGQSIGPPMAMQSPLGTGGLTQIANQQNSPIGDQETELQKLMRAVNQGYTPETSARDRFSQLLNTFPQRQPVSFPRALVAAGLSIGSKDPVKTSHEVMDAPNIRAMEDWKAKAEPFSKAAQEENTRNINERALIGNVISAQSQANALKERGREADLKNEQMLARNRIADLKARMGQGWKIDAHNGTTIKMYNTVTGELKDTGESTRWMDEADKIDAEGQYRVEAAKATGAAGVERVRAGQQGPIVVGGVVHNYNPITKEYEPTKGLPEGDPTKLGTPSQASNITTGTRIVMEGAKMLLPHITDLRAQAADLNKRGLFGPVMSRIRTLASKIGTTGDASDVQKSFDEFSNAITSDPLINQSNDRAVGNFVATLGLMASGTGRVHGGARGGGSIQMVNYMKSLLNSDSTLDMFNGRMDALDSFMKGYAIGPGGAAPTKKVTTGVTDGVTGNQRIVVQSPDGKKFTLPAEQLDEFLKSPQGKGYQRVGK